LFGLFQQLSGAGGSTAGPLALPQHQPLPKIDEHDSHDLAPESTAATADPS
jgi:hypothetical protein